MTGAMFSLVIALELVGSIAAGYADSGAMEDVPWPTHLGGEKGAGPEAQHRLGSQLCDIENGNADCEHGYFCGVPPDVFAFLHFWLDDEGMRYFCIPTLREGQFCDPSFIDACEVGTYCLVEEAPVTPNFVPEFDFYRCQIPGVSHLGNQNPYFESLQNTE